MLTTAMLTNAPGSLAGVNRNVLLALLLVAMLALPVLARIAERNGLPVLAAGLAALLGGAVVLAWAAYTDMRRRRR